MGHRQRSRSKHYTGKRGQQHPPTATAGARVEAVASAPVLELVLVSDTVGTLDAAAALLARVSDSGAAVHVIHKGLGAVSKSDVTMAATGSRLVLGFNVGVQQQVDALARAEGVEVRLCPVIYRLQQDVEEIAASLVERPAEEHISGRARVIALFKGPRKGAILGCEVEQGRLAVGDRFRLVGVAGTEYEGVAESLHIGPSAVRAAHVGQQVGLKISDFKQARVGDVVETFAMSRTHTSRRWSPRGGVVRRS